MVGKHKLDECPSCSRKFEKLEDFPLIYLRNLQIREIPSDLVFPYAESYKSFVDVGSDVYNGGIAPQEVLGFFKQNPPTKPDHPTLSTSKIFPLDGWNWRAKWWGDEILYDRSQEDQKQIILRHLNLYLDTLEGCVRTEVPRSHFLPPFNQDSYSGYFDIPETGYKLEISEKKNNDRIRKANFDIVAEDDGWPMTRIAKMATIANIEYEGRLIH